MFLVMSGPDEAPTFYVGGRYENRAGLFEVVAIDGDSMRIRWDTGREVTTPIALQQKILANMEREVLEAAARKHRNMPRFFGEFFRGLEERDFTEDVTGTHWRSREQLGGAVTRLLNVKSPFNSWSIYGRPEIHWATISRYASCHPSLQTKFFARANGEALLFGAYVERSDNPSDNQNDWRKFSQWLAQPKHSKWLHAALLRCRAVITNPYNDWSDLSFYGTMTPTETGYVWNKRGTENSTLTAEQLPSVFADVSDQQWVNLVFGRMIPKAEAIHLKSGVAEEIATLFELLMPLYESRPPV